jgi:hypothetical protein
MITRCRLGRHVAVTRGAAGCGHHPRRRVRSAARVVTRRVRTAVRTVNPCQHGHFRIIPDRYRFIGQGRTRHVGQRIGRILNRYVVRVTLGALIRLIKMLVVTDTYRSVMGHIDRAVGHCGLPVVTVVARKDRRTVPCRRLIRALVVTTRRRTRAVGGARISHVGKIKAGN